MGVTPKKLNIGFFTDTYIPQINGVVVSIKMFKDYLEKLGHNVYIFCPKDDNYREKPKDKNKIFRFRSRNFIFQKELKLALPFSLTAFRKMPELKLDIIHSHTPFTLGIFAVFISAFYKVPLVHTYHTLYPEYVKSYIFKGKVITPKMAEKITAAYCNHCSGIIAPSPKMKKLLLGYGVSKTISVLPTGVELKRFRQVKKNNFKQRFNIPSGAKVLIYVGRAAEEKNIEFIIRSFQLVKKAEPKAFLALVSGGLYAKKLEALIKKMKLKDAIITGYLQYDEVPSAYQASDLFVFASKTDTQGLVILEAGISGLPIVAINDGAFEGILRDGVNGYITGENKKEFADKIIAILSNSSLYRSFSGAAKRIASKYSAMEQAHKTVDFYNHLIINEKKR